MKFNLKWKYGVPNSQKFHQKEMYLIKRVVLNFVQKINVEQTEQRERLDALKK